MHKCCLELQQMMKHCKKICGEYYILKMDVAKYFDIIDKKNCERIYYELH